MKKNEIERRLSSYGDFLLKRAMVSPGKEQCFILWVRRFFYAESSFKGRTWEEKLPQYLDRLAGEPKIASWQVDQADQAVRLYFQNFYAAEKLPAKGTLGSTIEDPGWFDSQKALEDLKEWMRIKHYAYKTEQSYLNWCKRFFHYSGECSEVYQKGCHCCRSYRGWTKGSGIRHISLRVYHTGPWR